MDSSGKPILPENVEGAEALPSADPAEGASGYALLEEVGRPRGPLRHERSLPLPFRVKSGSLREDRLVLETANEVMELPWSTLRLVALGVVEEKHETDSTTYNLEKMVGGVGRMVKGSGGRDESKITSLRETYLLDLYAQGLSEPLRLDSSHINYRSFLGQISYISFQNFFRLVHAVASRATGARFTPALVHFLTRQRDRVQRFSAVYDFELDTQARLQALDSQPSWSDLDLGRTSWAEEWSED